MWDENRNVVVMGATGQQGGSVAAALHDAGWRVRAVVRDPSSLRAHTLGQSGVDVVHGDMSDVDSLRSAFSGARGVFSVQPSSGQPGADVTDDEEVAFGANTVTAAQQAEVEHFVYTSATAAGPTPTGVAHFDTKGRIEALVRDVPMPSTIIRPTSFMELVTSGDTGIANGEVEFLMRHDQPMQFIAVRDIGLVVAQIFASPTEFDDRTVDLAGDSLTGDALARQLGHAVGRRLSYRRLRSDSPGSDTMLARLMDLVDDGRLAGHADVAALRERFPFILTFEQWLAGPGKSLLVQMVDA